MKIKIISLFVCMLLTVTGIPANGTVKEKSDIHDMVKSRSPFITNTWIKTFDKGRFDGATAVQQTSDSGYIIVGITQSYVTRQQDVWLIKTDASGNKIWDKTFGGRGRDVGNSVQQTSDGGYIITGSTASYGNGEDDVWLIKTDANGNKVWDKTFGYSIHDSGSEVKQTSDGGFILIGDVFTDGGGSGDIWVIKTDGNGTKIWDKIFDGKGRPISHDYGTSIGLTADNGYILLGETFTTDETNNYDLWLIKLDFYGTTIWDKKIGGTDDEIGWSVQQTTDGGYIITGVDTYGGASGDTVWLIKTDTLGTIIWDRTYNGIQAARGYSVKQTHDNGYIVAGEIFLGSRYKALLIKTDTNGEKEWSKTFGGIIPGITLSVQQTTDGGYIITGNKGRYCSDVWLIKTDENGNSPLSQPIAMMQSSVFPDLFRFV